MIKVSITEDDKLRNEIEFDDANLVSRAGSLTVVHRRIMERCPDEGLWHRVAYAARILAERDDLLDALMDENPHQAETDADTALSATSPDIPPDLDDSIRGERTTDRGLASDDLYHLERDPGETDEEYQERARMLGCDEHGRIRLPRRRAMTECRVGCIICGRELENWSGGDNQPVGGLAFQCSGHWPSAVFDAEPGWLEINICERCLRRAVARRRVLHGHRTGWQPPATYQLWQWPKRR
jgi:hypothetical protein